MNGRLTSKALPRDVTHSVPNGRDPVGEGSESEEAEVDRLCAAMSSVKEAELAVERERFEVWTAEEQTREVKGKAEETTPGSLGV